ncbi:MAG: TldD/PmbA family protein [Bacteroidales bacterium]|nr:TldD/PmbA family protein [Bacteroidales bacterium]
MNREIYDLCRWVIDTAKKYGATDSKARMSRRKFVEIRYRDRKPEVVKEATTRGLNLDIYIGGKFSSQSTPDLRKDALEDFIKKAVDNTHFIEDDQARSLPDQKYYAGRIDKNLQLADPEHNELTPEKQHEIAKTIENSCLEKTGDKVISVEAGTNKSEWEELILTSNGFEGTTKTTDCWAGASVTVADEGDRRPNGYFWAGARSLADMPSLDYIGEEAARRTLDLLGGKKIKTVTLPVIVENRVVGNLLNGFLSGLYGGNIQQKRSFLANKKGEQVAANLFTIIDDPLIEKAFGSRLYDGDGFPAKQRTIVKNGTIENFFIDWYYSRKLNCEPTTGGTSNLIIPPGDKSPEMLMKDLGRGILITGFIGGNSNSATGDFSIGIIGKLFENGVPVQSVAEMNIADNHLNFWNKLAAIGNDPWKYGDWLTPSLVFSDVMVAGI